MGKVLVYGLGESGKGAMKLAAELGNEVACYADDLSMEVPIGVEDRRNVSNLEELFIDIDLLIISPSVESNAQPLQFAKSLNITIKSEIQYASDNCKAGIIAITGTNGKTTTTRLIEKLFNYAGISAYALGNIGVSYASKAKLLTESDVAVLEMSSFQLEQLDNFKPKFAILLNITPDHLERHKNMANYINAKKRIFKWQDSGDYAILNYDDEEARSITSEISSNTYYFSRKSIVKGAYLCGNFIYFKDGDTTEAVCPINDIKLAGDHNLENVLACVTLAKILNYPNNVIESVITNFMAPRHRIEYIGNINGKNYYNDSKSTNDASTLVACKAMVGKTTLIMGGYDKGLSYKEFFENLPLKIASLICYGANRNRLIQEAIGLTSLTVIEAVDLSAAVETASKIQAKNVLFSPGTSSYDSFKDYKDRGDTYIKLVRKL